MTKRDQIERDYLNGMEPDAMVSKYGYASKNSMFVSMSRWGISLPVNERVKRFSDGGKLGIAMRHKAS